MSIAMIIQSLPAYPKAPVPRRRPWTSANARLQRLWHARTDPVPSSRGVMRGGRLDFGGLKTALRVQGARALQDNAYLSERPCPSPSYPQPNAQYFPQRRFVKRGALRPILTTVSLGSRRRVIGPVLKFVRHTALDASEGGMMRAIPANAKTAMDATFEN